MPKHSKNRGSPLNPSDANYIEFMNFLLFKLQKEGNISVEQVRKNIGLTTQAGMLNLLQHIASNWMTYRNFIIRSLNENPQMYNNLLGYNNGYDSGYYINNY
jgi:hypothetical protein